MSNSDDKLLTNPIEGYFELHNLGIILEDLNLSLEGLEFHELTFMRNTMSKQIPKDRIVNLKDIPERIFTKYDKVFIIEHTRNNYENLLIDSNLQPMVYLTWCSTIISNIPFYHSNNTVSFYAVKLDNLYHYQERLKAHCIDREYLRGNISCTFELPWSNDENTTFLGNIKHKFIKRKPLYFHVTYDKRYKPAPSSNKYGDYFALLCKSKEDYLDLWFRGGCFYLTKVIDMKETISESVLQVHLEDSFEVVMNLLKLYYKVGSAEREKLLESSRQCNESIYKACYSLALIAYNTDVRKCRIVLGLEEDTEVAAAKVSDEYYNKLSSMTQLYTELSGIPQTQQEGINDSLLSGKEKDLPLSHEEGEDNANLIRGF